MTNMAPDNALTVLAAMFSIGFGIIAIVVSFVQMRRQRQRTDA